MQWGETARSPNTQDFAVRRRTNLRYKARGVCVLLVSGVARHLGHKDGLVSPGVRELKELGS